MATLEEVLSNYRNHPEFLGIELTRADQRGAVDDTPLHIAARRGALEDIMVLVAHGAGVNLPGDLGNTPLHQAAMTGQTSAVLKLLELGADPALRNEFSETALRVAQLGGHAKVIDALSRWTK
jgi:uncharacterized protein